MRQNKKTKKLFTVVALILCVVFGFILLCNLILIVKGVVAPDKPPAVFGIIPMVVQSGSMSGTAKDHIEVGDLIFIKKTEINKLKERDIISFMDDGIVVTHRVISIDTTESGKLQLTTQGDANNAADDPITEDKFLGIYKARIPKLGDFAMFLQKPLGMILFIGVPLCAFIIYDIIRRQRQANKELHKTSEMEAEIERLRALTKEPESSEAPPSDKL